MWIGDLQAMAKRSGTIAYNTNLASEFHMMSLFHLAGSNASLSLGNKKGVDIMLNRADRISEIIEVKGVAGDMDWMITESGAFPSGPNLFYPGLCS
jgi:hypothetical protein